MKSAIASALRLNLCLNATTRHSLRCPSRRSVSSKGNSRLRTAFIIQFSMRFERWNFRIFSHWLQLSLPTALQGPCNLRHSLNKTLQMSGWDSAVYEIWMCAVTSKSYNPKKIKKYSKKKLCFQRQSDSSRMCLLFPMGIIMSWRLTRERSRLPWGTCLR